MKHSKCFLKRLIGRTWAYTIISADVNRLNGTTKSIAVSKSCSSNQT